MNPVELTDDRPRPRAGQRANGSTGELNLGGRVTFIEWIKEHSQVATTLQQFRAFVLPEPGLEANGIVVQEAMLLGVAGGGAGLGRAGRCW